MNFFQRLFGRKVKPAPPRGPDDRESAPRSGEGSSASDLIGPPEGDSPMVAVRMGDTLMITDRLTYEYQKGLARGTDPSQSDLDAVFAKLDRIRVLAGGMMREKSLGVEVLLDTRDRVDLASLHRALRSMNDPRPSTIARAWGGRRRSAMPEGP